MKITYDPKFNIAYIELKEKNETVNSIKISDELIVDVSGDGSVYGIELLNANEQLAKQENGKLSFINLFSGQKLDFFLPI